MITVKYVLKERVNQMWGNWAGTSLFISGKFITL